MLLQLATGSPGRSSQRRSRSRCLICKSRGPIGGGGDCGGDGGGDGDGDGDGDDDDDDRVADVMIHSTMTTTHHPPPPPRSLTPPLMSQRSAPLLLPLPSAAVVGGFAEASDVNKLFVSDSASNCMCGPRTSAICNRLLLFLFFLILLLPPPPLPPPPPPLAATPCPSPSTLQLLPSGQAHSLSSSVALPHYPPPLCYCNIILLLRVIATLSSSSVLL